MLRNVRIETLCEKAGTKNPRTAVKKLVRNLQRGLGQNTPPYRAESYCEIAGVTFEKVFLYGCDGRLIPAKSGWIAQISDDLPKKRQDFALCHEIGHTFFEEDLKSPTKSRFDSDTFRISSTAEEEELCDFAAAEMLMPTKIFSDYVRETEPSLVAVWSLAKIFRVSAYAVMLRIITLDLWEALVMCCAPIETEFHGTIFDVLSSRASASAFNKYMKAADTIYCLRSMLRSSSRCAELGVLEAYNLGGQVERSFSLTPLQKSFTGFSYRIGCGVESTLMLFIVRSGPE